MQTNAFCVCTIVPIVHSTDQIWTEQLLRPWFFNSMFVGA